MTTTAKPSNGCPSCGKPLPDGALAGLCPACLLAQGAETETSHSASGRPFHPLSLPEVAALFPQLEILSLLGAGGMGAVYQARQRALDRFVALKILPATGANSANFAERFNREARALARLSHPNIVGVHEFGQAGDLHYFLMEFVDGANLRQLEKAGRLSSREALQIIPQICDALQYAHDEGVVHRDIKPENVLVDRKGRVKIADFGLAKILGVETASARLTMEGQVMGTPHYMAPEQVERPLAVDHRADIYSLGVVFYEMLTGDLPLGKFAPPSRKVQVDVRLDEVVLRALENDPERRYQNVSEVKSQVETIVDTPAPSSSAAGTPAATTLERCLHWGRFAVVRERDGERKINWRGVLPLYFINFGVLSLLFGIVTVATGRSLWGWLGVMGWPSVVVRLLIAAVFVAIQVRRIFVRPEGAETCTTWITRRLSPRALRWLGLAKVVGFIALCAGGWVWFQFAWLIPHLKQWSGDFPAAEVAAREARTGALVADLPGGGRIELLAVGEPNAAPHGWWAPDGTPFTNTTYEVRGAAEGSQSGRLSKDLLFRVTDLPGSVSQTGFETFPAAGGGSGGLVLRDGRQLDGGVQARFAWKPGVDRATIRQGFGLAPWRAIATANTGSQSVTVTRLPEHPNWVVNFHHPASEAKGEAHVSVVFGPDDRLWTQRVVAVDTNGVAHFSSEGHGTPVEKLTLWTYTWRGLPLETVKEFRLEVRPVHWVAFPDVALTPRSRVAAPAPAQFGPVTTIDFDELIDFDTGRTAGFPTDRTSGSFFEGLGENVLWAVENGFDAEAGAGELNLIQLDLGAASNEDWDTLGAAELLARFERNHYRPRGVIPEKDATLPVTYAFRTREHGLGLLQITAFKDGRPGASVRFKLVTKADAP